jgi:phosphohistidine swiveling domain-containing protein
MQGKKRVVSEVREMDALTAEIVADVDEAAYVPTKLPRALRGIVLKMILQNLGLGWGVLKALRNPTGCKQRYLEEERQLGRDLAMVGEEEDELTTREFATRTMARMISYTKVFMPCLFVAIIARSRIKRLFRDDGPEIRDQVIYLERALPHNVTIGMGLAMYRLASFKEIRECSSGVEFASKLEERDFSSQFLAAWDAFIETYGFRSPMEMDPAASRFYERPAQFFEQLRTMADNTDPSSSPQAIYDKAKAERESAYRVLLRAAEQKGRRKARRFARDYATWVDLGGLRESPKYYFVLIADMFRRRVLKAAQALVDAGRLDSVEQVFDLHIDDLDRALTDPSLDLRALAAENTRFLSKFRQVRALPRVVDSRGKILRPPKREASEGELAGEPISTGTVRGKTKVLHRPDEKPVLPGEILVARATDPGWTPLFLNAGGIVLEVGGALQHGALVAREYGKPCVAGIENATSILGDGQMVELDGANGIVRLV